MPRLSLLLLALTCLYACHPDPPQYDLIIRNGVLYDGSGKPGFRGDLAIQGDSIAALGDLGNAKGKVEVAAGVPIGKRTRAVHILLDFVGIGQGIPHLLRRSVDVNAVSDFFFHFDFALWVYFFFDNNLHYLL